MSKESHNGNVTIRALTREESPIAGDVIADSHGEYPSFTHLFPNPTQRSRVLKRLMTGAARDAQAFGTVKAASEEGRILGVAIWLPPGRFPWSSWRKAKAAGTFAPLLWQTRGSTSEFFALGGNAANNAPTEPHWYLQVLGIRKEAQHRGLGSELVRSALSHADREGSLCYLETADRANLGFYERFNFEFDRRIQLIPDGPPHYSMRRPPPFARLANVERTRGATL